MHTDMIREAVQRYERMLTLYNPHDSLWLGQAWSELKAPYAHLYGKRHLGDGVGPGWWDILQNVFKQIDLAIKEHPGSTWQVEQIKEKFGTLRIYGAIEGSDDFCNQVDTIIRQAESASEQICEECGEPGTQTGPGWIKVLCDRHALMHAERQRARFKT